jgi:hypothetical protein
MPMRPGLLSSIATMVWACQLPQPAQTDADAPAESPSSASAVPEVAVMGSAAPEVEVVGVQELPAGLRELALQSAREQADAGAGAKVRLLRAWPYAPPPDLEAASNAKLVAIDFELDIPGNGFDLDDIDILDADSNENYGSDPILQRLNARGEPVAFDDPDVAADNHHFRLLGVWAVPRTTHRVELGYWNASLGAPITIAGPVDRLRVMEDASTVVAYGVGNPVDGEQVHLLWVECQCSRVGPHPSYELTTPATLLDEARVIAIEADGTPSTTPITGRPRYGRFAWLTEYRTPPGTRVTGANRFGERTPLRSLRRFEPTPAQLEALGRIPLERRD